MNASPPEASRVASSLDEPHLQGLRWCLVVSIGVMGVAVGWKALVYPGAFFSLLFMGRGWSEDAALTASRVAAWVLIVASFVCPWRRAWPALVAIAAWMVWLSVLAMVEPDVQRPALILGEHAVRIVGPLVLAWLVASTRPGGRERVAIMALQIAAAATFTCHGIEALTGSYAFLDYVFALEEVLGVEIEQGVAEKILIAIGVADLVVSVAILLPAARLRRSAAAYMAAWGLITAASRTVHSGMDGLFDTLMRLPNGGVPLALVLYWRLRPSRE